MSENQILNINLDLIDNLKWDDKGLIPSIVQDIQSGDILMVAWLNKESLQMTLDSGNATFWSRSRQELWMKGGTSGNTMKVQSILMDCDGDTLILLSDAAGPACHTGERTCFYRTLAKRSNEDETGCPGCSGCSE
ncbi:phosphoribosyl-AMP cyclohydrolase [candidate division KSB1 bacterium]|nr:phosphoribosyl-AMP cyclohydrolase [candidate division KSB1 bacterium]